MKCFETEKENRELLLCSALIEAKKKLFGADYIIVSKPDIVNTGREPDFILKSSVGEIYAVEITFLNMIDKEKEIAGKIDKLIRTIKSFFIEMNVVLQLDIDFASAGGLVQLHWTESDLRKFCYELVSKFNANDMVKDIFLFNRFRCHAKRADRLLILRTVTVPEDWADHLVNDFGARLPKKLAQLEKYRILGIKTILVTYYDDFQLSNPLKTATDISNLCFKTPGQLAEYYHVDSSQNPMNIYNQNGFVCDHKVESSKYVKLMKRSI